MAYISFQPSDFFNTVLWAGNSTDPTSITGVGFQPDMLWIKNRSSGSYNHHLVDSSRGVSNRLVPNGTQAEGTSFVNSFSSDGFSLTDNATVNGSSNNYVGWNWKSNGGTTSSNTDGSITSTVQANTTSGFSIVTYTGTGANATIGHGLGKSLDMILVKNRSASGRGWVVWHNALAGNEALELNSTDAKITSATSWNSTVPTSSVFSVGTRVGTNESSQTFVAYCFAEIKGFSRFGSLSYTGNGSDDGPFIYTGFRPAFILGKPISQTGEWFMFDSARDPDNGMDKYIYASNSSSEGTGSVRLDFLSNGFKWRNTAAAWNGSGVSYVFMAFAEFPLIGSNGIVGTAR